MQYFYISFDRYIQLLRTNTRKSVYASLYFRFAFTHAPKDSYSNAIMSAGGFRDVQR